MKLLQINQQLCMRFFFANLTTTDLHVSLIVESDNLSYVVGNQIKIRKNTSLSWDKPINLAPTEETKSTIV